MVPAPAEMIRPTKPTRLAYILATVSMAAGCASTTSGFPGGSTIDGPVIVTQLTEESDSEDGGFAGQIAVDGDCLALQPDSGAAFGVAWPSGTTWSDGDKSLQLQDGRRIRHGDSISGSGGYWTSGLELIIADRLSECGLDGLVVVNGELSRIEINAP